MNFRKDRRPLEGVRVLEMGRLIAAPSCGQILADLGADVIKIERVGSGDDVRNYGPPFLPDGAGDTVGASPFFLAFNRNKRSIAIDFAKPEGADLVRALARRSHVFIENYKVGSLRKYGLDKDAMRTVCPDLLYLSVSGFGQEGPYAARPATDVLIQGMSGLMQETGRPEGPPEKVGVPVVDMVTGVYGALAVIAALYRGEKHGGAGGWAGVSLLDCGMSLMAPSLAWAALAGAPLHRVGTDAQGSAPSGVFACRGGEVLLQAGKDADFAKLCRLIGLEPLIDDPRFSARPRRVENWPILRPLLVDAIASWDRTEFFNSCVAAGIVCGPINRTDEALRDPQVRFNGVEQPADHPDMPNLNLTALPIRFDDDGVTPIDRPPPRLGEHTADILRDDLDMDDEAIGKLATRGVIEVRSLS